MKNDAVSPQSGSFKSFKNFFISILQVSCPRHSDHIELSNSSTFKLNEQSLIWS